MKAQLLLAYTPPEYRVPDSRREVDLETYDEELSECALRGNFGGTDDWTICIVFLPTRESWRAAWRMARLLANANLHRPALFDHSTLIAIAGMFCGEKIQTVWRAI
jgi:hypothetical protein